MEKMIIGIGFSKKSTNFKKNYCRTSLINWIRLI